MDTEIERDEHAQQFVILHNHVARDRTLTRRARGLLAELLSYPPSCKVTFETLLRGGPEKRDALRAMLRELETAGFITRTKRQGNDGRWQHKLTVRETPKVPDVAEPDVSAGHVQDGFSAGGRPAAGEGVDKNVKNGNPKDEDQKMASRRARSSAASAIWTDEDKIDGVRTAIADVYGDAENEWISDDECLELYGIKAPKSGRVGTPAGYMTKIFSDTPNLSTHLAGLGADLETDDEPPGRPTWTCPRCEGTTGAPTERGVCVWCDAELAAAPAPKWPHPVLDAIKTALFVAVGYVADDAWAAKVATHIIGTRSVARPAEYVTSAITADSDPRRFTPTWTPAPARAA